MIAEKEIHCRSGAGEIIADTGGLRWRSEKSVDWQSARWEEVTDFYLEPPGNDAVVNTTEFTVQFRDGRRLNFSAFWGNWQSLCDAIALRSPNAEAARMPDGTMQWVTKGLRPVDLPVSFTYSESHVQKIRETRNQTTGCLTALAILLPPLAIFLAMNLPGPVGGVIAAFAVSTVFVVTIPSIIRRLFRRIREGRQYREALRRAEAGERFEVTADTLTFWQNGESHRVPWSEIIGYDEPVFTLRPKQDTVRIRTTTGKEFSFTSLLEGAERFAQILPLYATNAVPYRRGQNEKEAIGGVQARWTGGEEGKGDRVFHLRTRTNLQKLWLGGISILFPLVASFLVFDRPQLWLFLSLLAINLCLHLPGTLRYFRDRIVVGKESMSLWRDGKETGIRWLDLTASHIAPHRIVLESRNDTTQGLMLEFNPSEYAYGNELPDLIRENLERAQVVADRAAVAASDVAQPEGGSRVWNQEAEPDVEPQKVMRNI